MDWTEAIEQSKKGTAFRKVKEKNYDITYVRYGDGRGYKLVAENGKVNYDLSRAAIINEIEGFNDWQPS